MSDSGVRKYLDPLRRSETHDKCQCDCLLVFALPACSNGIPNSSADSTDASSGTTSSARIDRTTVPTPNEHPKFRWDHSLSALKTLLAFTAPHRLSLSLHFSETM